MFVLVVVAFTVGLTFFIIALAQKSKKYPQHRPSFQGSYRPSRHRGSSAPQDVDDTTYASDSRDDSSSDSSDGGSSEGDW